jgi:hypothetical protein
MLDSVRHPEQLSVRASTLQNTCASPVGNHAHGVTVTCPQAKPKRKQTEQACLPGISS